MIISSTPHDHSILHTRIIQSFSRIQGKSFNLYDLFLFQDIDLIDSNRIESWNPFYTDSGRHSIGIDLIDPQANRIPEGHRKSAQRPQ
jgi:hypothetical protein